MRAVEAALKQRIDRAWDSPPLHRSIADLGQATQQTISITNCIRGHRKGASPQSRAALTTAQRPSPLPVWTNPYYQKYGQATNSNCSEQLHSVDHGEIEDTLEDTLELTPLQLVLAYRLNSSLAHRPSIDESQQRGVIRSTAAEAMGSAAVQPTATFVKADGGGAAEGDDARLSTDFIKKYIHFAKLRTADSTALERGLRPVAKVGAILRRHCCNSPPLSELQQRRVATRRTPPLPCISPCPLQAN